MTGGGRAMVGQEQVPESVRSADAQARRLARWTVAYLVSAGLFLYLVLDSSLAMKAAWLETVFSIATPLLFLAAGRALGRPADRKYPYGYYGWISIAYLCAALTLFALGVYLAVDAALKLMAGGSGGIGSVRILDHTVWFGWPMLAALAWSAVPAWFIGRAQAPRSRVLHDKLLNTDAKMRSADWQTSIAAAVGILGISAGWWWMDPVAGGAIAASVMLSGYRQLRHAASDLAHSAPTTIDRRPDPLSSRIAERLVAHDWVVDAEVRLREQGRLVFGEVYVVPRSDRQLTDKLAQAAREIRAMDWRVHRLSVMPVASIEDTEIAEIRHAGGREGPGVPGQRPRRR